MNGHMNEIFFCRHNRGLSLSSEDSHEQWQHCSASARFDRGRQAHAKRPQARKSRRECSTSSCTAKVRPAYVVTSLEHAAPVQAQAGHICVGGLHVAFTLLCREDTGPQPRSAHATPSRSSPRYASSCRATFWLRRKRKTAETPKL